MASICFGGQVQMKIDESSMVQYDDPYACLAAYPHKIPRVYLEGHGEDYLPQYRFSWNSDAVVMVRDNFIVEYTKFDYTELLAEDENGKLIWMDGRTAPYAGCWSGKYLGKDRDAYEYRVVEYDLVAREKKIYTVRQAETTKFDEWDVNRITELYGEDAFSRDLTTKSNEAQPQVVETTNGFCF